MKNQLPKIVVTLGDPAGIGPEVTARALLELRDSHDADYLVVGHQALMDKAFCLIGQQLEIRTLPVEPLPENPTEAQRGRYVFSAIHRAVSMCLEKKADAMVTAPLNKAVLKAGGHDYPGHTEILGKLCGREPVMMLLGGPLKVVPLTTHLPLRQVSGKLNREMVSRICRIVYHAMDVDFGIGEPRIALTGLNPHAGECGLFGNEEIEILTPAVQDLEDEGILITGPLAADTAFYRAAKGEFDVVISPTHDQALIPLKLLAFDRAVNVTLNLPIVRTSPGHGTAEEIAWTGRANHQSMSAAMKTAARIARNRSSKERF